MDYPNRRRVKIWGRAEVVEGESDLLSQLKPEGYKAQGERVFLFHLRQTPNTESKQTALSAKGDIQ